MEMGYRTRVTTRFCENLQLTAFRIENMQSNPVGWFEIYVQDMPRAQAFYETVFGQSLTPLPSPDGKPVEMMAFPMEMNLPGAAGALAKMEGVPSGGNSVMVYFGCEDCSVESSRVADAGGMLMRAKFPIGEHGFIAIAQDTEGNVFGLHSMK